MWTALAFYSVPTQWLGLMIVYFVADRVGLPHGGIQSPDYGILGNPGTYDFLVDRTKHMILPALTLGLVLYGDYTLIVRSAMLETLGEDYVLTARAKGLSNWAIVWKHGFRNAMLPVVTLIALSLGFIIGGAITIEYVFDYPGHRPGHRRCHRQARLRLPPGRLPGADAVGDPVQLHRRPALLQARSAGDDVSHVTTPPTSPETTTSRPRPASRLTPGRRGFITTTLLRPAAGDHRPDGRGAVHPDRDLRAADRDVQHPREDRRRSTRRRAARTGWAPTTAASTCSRCSSTAAGSRSRSASPRRFVAMVIGGTVGVVSGFFGGWIDVLLMRITDIFLVIPDLPLIIVVAAIFGRNLINIIIIIGIIYWTSTARLMRVAGEERARTRVREAGEIDRRRQQPAGVQARAAAGGAAADRQHGADDRAGGVPGDLHHVPRPGRPQHRSRGAS